MAGQPGFFDGEERLKALSAAGDPLERLAQVIDFEVFPAAPGDLATREVGLRLSTDDPDVAA